jgi:hypothetical protein
MPDAPLVTALVLTRFPARAAMLEDALLAFRLQTYPRKEALIVNDGEPITCATPGATVLNLPRPAKTVGSKRNIGLEAARGALVAVWDDDDFSLPERLADSVAHLEATGGDYFRTLRFWVANEALHVIALCGSFGMPTAVFRRDVALRVGGFADVNYAEDWYMMQALEKAGAKLVDAPLESYVYRRHGTNVSTAHAGETLEAWKGNAIATPPGAIEAVNARLASLRAGPRRPHVTPVGGRLPSHRDEPALLALTRRLRGSEGGK